MTTQELRRSSRLKVKGVSKKIDSEPNELKKKKNLKAAVGKEQAQERTAEEKEKKEKVQNITGLEFEKISVLLLDIEGTTTSISFVKDVLFLYVKQGLLSFLAENWDKEKCKSCILDLVNLSLKDSQEGHFKNHVPIPSDLSLLSKESQVEAIAKNVEWMMAMDRKVGPLKKLQGYMWKSAYESGIIKGHIYDDVVPALERWINSGKKIYIYSSGSIDAQKLLFGFSEKGDLTRFFSGHFDTSIGLKIHAQSYQSIVESIGVEPSEILFLTDNILECKAAKDAGLETINLCRPGNAEIDSAQLAHFKQISSFDCL